MLGRFLCRVGLHSWRIQLEEWNLPQENGYTWYYICDRCYSAKKILQVTDAPDYHKGRCVSETVEEWRYEE